MIIFLSYLLKVGACLAVFFLAYKITLSKETFFKLNRLLLLVSIVLSIILPIWTITIIKEIVVTQVPQIYQVIGEGSDITGQIYRNSNYSTFDWADLLPFIGLGIYLLGVIIFSIRKVIGFNQISRIMKNSRKEVTANAKLYIFSKSVIPFSWFDNVIISEEDYVINKEIIIEHEKAHIRLGHSYDLIFINLMTVFEWFNPFVWLIRKELVSVHEFQADNHVINKGIDAKKYQYLLISKGTAHCFSLPVVNHLCSGNFKQRIKMMLKKRSNPQSAIKALLLIPLVAGAIAAFAKTEYVETAPEANASEYSNLPALAQNLQKQDGFIYFVDGKEVSEEVINKMSLSEFVSYKIYKREEAVEKFGEKAKNGAVEIITRAGKNITQEYSKPPKDSQVRRNQILPITVKRDGSYVLGSWSDKTSHNNTANATKSNIENIIKEIIPRMIYSKDSVIVFITFEPQESPVKWFENLSPLKDALVNFKIKNISVQRSENDKKLDTISDNNSDSKTNRNSSVVQKVKNQELSNFQILVESINGDIKLTGIKGCAFIELTFKLGDEKSQAVDQFGMSTIDREKNIKDNNLADFLFTIKKTKNGLRLEGIEGTAWKELSIISTENRCYQLIDQNGMKNISPASPNTEMQLVININDVGYFLINNKIVKDINNLESVIKNQIEKLKAISNEPIIVKIQTSSKTPIESVNKVNEILKKENITKISYITPRKLN